MKEKTFTINGYEIEYDPLRGHGSVSIDISFVLPKQMQCWYPVSWTILEDFIEEGDEKLWNYLQEFRKKQHIIATYTRGKGKDKKMGAIRWDDEEVVDELEAMDYDIKALIHDYIDKKLDFDHEYKRQQYIKEHQKEIGEACRELGDSFKQMEDAEEKQIEKEKQELKEKWEALQKRKKRLKKYRKKPKSD